MNTKQFYENVWDVLQSLADAPEHLRQMFVDCHVETNPCDEFRFQGQLGFGGKYRRKTNRVDCYPEDETPERLALVNALNSELAKLS